MSIGYLRFASQKREQEDHADNKKSPPEGFTQKGLEVDKSSLSQLDSRK